MERAFRISILLVCLATAPRARASDAAWPDDGPSASAGRDSHLDQLLPRARTAFLAGKYAEADGLYATAIQRWQTTGSENKSLARAFYELGAVRKLEGRCEEASGLVVRGIRMLESAPHPDAHELVEAWGVLGAAYYCGHLYSNAERAYARALDLARGTAVPDRKALFESQAGLGAVYQSEGKYSRAEETYRSARAILKESSQIEPRSQAFLLGNLGALLRAEGRYPESEAALHEGFATLEKNGGVKSEVAAYLLNNLAMVQMERKAYREAAVLLGKAADLIKAGVVVPPADVALLLRNYAVCLRKTGEKDKAKEVQSQAGKLAGNVPPDHERGMVTDVAQLARGK